MRLDAAREDTPGGAGGRLTERALAELGIEWKNVMGFALRGDRVLSLERPAGYKRAYMLRGVQGVGVNQQLRCPGERLG